VHVADLARVSAAQDVAITNGALAILQGNGSIAVFTTAGAAVSVSGPVAVAALLTVTVPLCVVNVPVTSDGVGPANVTVAPVTVNVTELLVPFGVVTVTFLAVSGAPAPIVKVAVIVVLLTTTRALTVTPVPDTFTAVAPVRFVPVRVTGTAVPRTPEVGAIEARVGGGPGWSSTAPTSTAGLFAVFLGLPKKSVLGANAYVTAEFSSVM